MSGLIWAVMLLSAAIAITLPKPAGIRTLIITAIIRLIFSVGPEPTLVLLGSITVGCSRPPCSVIIRRHFLNFLFFPLQVMLKSIHLLSIMGNSGTFSRDVRQIVTDTEILYHVAYLVFCLMGVMTHPFFFSVLVRSMTNLADPWS